MSRNSGGLGDLLARVFIGLVVLAIWLAILAAARLVMLAAPYVSAAAVASTARLVRWLDPVISPHIGGRRSLLQSRGGLLILGALAWLLLGSVVGALVLSLLLAAALGAFGATPSAAAAQQAFVRGIAVTGLLAVAGAVLGVAAGGALANRLDFFRHKEGIHVLDDSPDRS